jgi:hypothetical protein
MMARFKALCAAAMVVAGALSAASPARAAFVHLTLQSQPGDFIGQGMNFDITYTSPDPSSISAQIRRTLPDGSPAELLWVLSGGVGDGPNTFALVFFGTDALGIPIQPGTYPNARRADFAPPGFAGLDVSFQNRGSNEVFGSFTITDVTFSPDRQQVLTFDASFEQHSESPTAPALFGTFTYNASGPPPPVPEPASLTLLGASAVCLLGYGWHRRTRTGRLTAG